MKQLLDDPSLIRTQAYIDGEWTDADDGATFDVLNPSNQEVIATVASVGAAETSRAVDAAARAQTLWAAKSPMQRSSVLRRWNDLILENTEDLAIIMTLEQGKILEESRGEITYSASFIEWFAEEGKRIYGDVVPLAQTDRRGIVIKQPVGVCAAITPWNFPSAMLARKAAPALAVGCAMVAKPPQETPLSMLALAELADRAGLPAGLLNVAPGNNAAAIGDELCSNPVVRKLTFTGSTPIGKLLARQCTDTMKRTSMELGGNAPVLVFDEATSSLDSHSEQSILDALREVAEHHTTLVIAHRLSTIVDADQILVMRDGRIIETGVHQSLLEKGGAYARLWRLQQEESRRELVADVQPRL